MKQKNGITLIALIITIIILLILAGISLNLLIGKNALIMKTNETIEETSEKMRQEAINLAIAEIHILKGEDTKLDDIKANCQILEKYLKGYKLNMCNIVQNEEGTEMLRLKMKKGDNEFAYIIYSNFDIKAETVMKTVMYSMSYSDTSETDGKIDALITIEYELRYK